MKVAMTNLAAISSLILLSVKGQVPPGEISCAMKEVKKSKIVAKVIGGTRAEPGQVTWQASIRDKETGCNFCGGAVANRGWILTAAHCMANKNPSEIIVAVGTNRALGSAVDFADIPEKEKIRGHQIVSVTKIISHPDYVTNGESDLALLQLTNEIKYPQGEHEEKTLVRPACFPTDAKSIVDHLPCTVSGYAADGSTSGGTCKDNYLDVGDVTAVSNEQCKKDWGTSALFTDKTVCAGSENGKVDACQSDSGGPLICKTDPANKPNDQVLVGLVRAGESCQNKHNSRRAGFYTNIGKFMPWMQKTMRKHSRIHMLQKRTIVATTAEVIKLTDKKITRGGTLPPKNLCLERKEAFEQLRTVRKGEIVEFQGKQITMTKLGDYENLSQNIERYSEKNDYLDILEEQSDVLEGCINKFCRASLWSSKFLSTNQIESYQCRTNLCRRIRRKCAEGLPTCKLPSMVHLVQSCN